MERRTFLSVVVGVVGAAMLPLSIPPRYDCDCGLVTYVKQPEGHFSATHFAGQRFTYALHRQHEHLHRKMAEKNFVEIPARD